MIVKGITARQLNRTAKDKISAKIRFMWTIPLKSDNIRQRTAPWARPKGHREQRNAVFFIITGLAGCDKAYCADFTSG